MNYDTSLLINQLINKGLPYTISKEIVDNGVYYTLLSKRGVEKILFSTTTKIWVQEYE